MSSSSILATSPLGAGQAWSRRTQEKGRLDFVHRTWAETPERKRGTTSSRAKEQPSIGGYTGRRRQTLRARCAPAATGAKRARPDEQESLQDLDAYWNGRRVRRKALLALARSRLRGCSARWMFQPEQELREVACGWMFPLQTEAFTRKDVSS
jgi:hypothetical protein